jgi:ribonuclease M5
MERMKIKFPILVEGKYDKITLSSFVDAKIISLSGFGVFNSKETQMLIRRLADERGVILLTDSDAGGLQIRSFISGIVPKEKLFHAYIPEIRGKEKRKIAPSKAGLLGVEGMDGKTLISALSPFAVREADATQNEKREITKTDFFCDGLSGGENSSELRKSLAKRLNLPTHMSANALICALNILYSYGEYKSAILEIKTNLTK